MAPPYAECHGNCECLQQFVSEAGMGSETMLQPCVLTHLWPKAQTRAGVVPFAVGNIPSSLPDHGLKLFCRHGAWDTAEEHPLQWDIALAIAAGTLPDDPGLPLRHVGC